MTSISEISRTATFSGNRFHKYADLGLNNNFSIDHSGGTKNSVYTSVDCYISGTYMGSDGKTMEIKQRYTVYVSYNRETQRTAMDDVRKRIMIDFSSNFPQFRISDVFIPDAKFIAPLGDGGRIEDAYFYYGSNLFKGLSRLDVARYKLQTEKNIYKTNVRNIKKQYGI